MRGFPRRIGTSAQFLTLRSLFLSATFESFRFVGMLKDLRSADSLELRPAPSGRVPGACNACSEGFGFHLLSFQAIGVDWAPARGNAFHSSGYTQPLLGHHAVGLPPRSRGDRPRFAPGGSRVRQNGGSFEEAIGSSSPCAYALSEKGPREYGAGLTSSR